LLAIVGLMHPKAFADTDIIPDVLIIEVFYSLIDNKLTISSQITQTLGPEKLDKPFYQLYTFIRNRIASFGQQIKH